MIPSHILFGVLALLTGAAVLAGPKGTRAHRRAGAAYVVSMLGLCAGSFGIGEGMGPFHVMAAISLATVAAGIVPALLRPRPAWWLDAHFNSMAWSYAGLVMALGSHLAGPVSAQLRVLLGEGPLPGLLAVVLLWGVPPLVCRWMLGRRASSYRARFGSAPRSAPDRPAAVAR